MVLWYDVVCVCVCVCVYMHVPACVHMYTDAFNSENNSNEYKLEGVTQECPMAFIVAQI